MCAFALTVNYFLDRIALMRTWKRAPRLGTTIASLNRNYFFPASVVAFAIISSFWWAGFQFDNLCMNENSTAPSFYADNWSIPVVEYESLFDTTGTLVVYNFTIDPGQPTYSYCDQNFLSYPNSRERSFPFIPQFQAQQYMTSDQELVTTVYGWSSVGVLLLFFIFVAVQILRWFYGYFVGAYKVSYLLSSLPLLFLLWDLGSNRISFYCLCRSFTQYSQQEMIRVKIFRSAILYLYLFRKLRVSSSPTPFWLVVSMELIQKCWTGQMLNVRMLSMI